MQIARTQILLCCQLSQGTFLPAESKDEFLQMHISIKQKQAHRHKEQTMTVASEEGEVEDKIGTGVKKYKLLYNKQISYKGVLCNIGNIASIL